MAQPNAEPVEEYEYAKNLTQNHLCAWKNVVHVADPWEYSYEALPPNFSLLQNMLAGAFAGIAVCTPHLTSHACVRLERA